MPDKLLLLDNNRKRNCDETDASLPGVFQSPRRWVVSLQGGTIRRIKVQSASTVTSPANIPRPAPEMKRSPDRSSAAPETRASHRL